MTDFLTRYASEPLDGKYRLIQRLGAGGMGEVFKAEHVILGATRVIKIVRPQISGSTEAQDRFLREARLATKVHHQNVASLHDFATLPDGSHYMVWEFIDGENLSQLMRRRGPLAPRLAIRLVVEALAGLDAVHRAGIVHRDISPENLMVTRDEEGVEHVKIIDLGVAKAEEGDTGMTRTGMFIGKLRYASPEHLGFLPEGERIDGRADLYSLAIVLYEMLTGRAPFEATSPHQYYIRYSREEALTKPDLEAVPGGPELQAALARALDRDRNRRFANAREFSEALQHAAAAIPDTSAMKTMAMDADETIRLTQSQTPFAPTVRTDYGTATQAPVPPPTLQAATEPVPQPQPAPQYTPPPPPPPAAPVTVIERAPARRSSAGVVIGVGLGVVLLLALAGIALYAALPLIRNRMTTSTQTTATTTQAAVVPPSNPATTSAAPSQTSVDVSVPSTTSSAPTNTTPAIISTTTTVTTPPATTTAPVAPKPKPQPKPVTTTTAAPAEETEAEAEPAPPTPQPSAAVHTYMDGRADSTWNAEALAYAKRQLSGVKSVAVQGSASGDPELREQLEQLLTRSGITVSPGSDTTIRFHGKIERRSLGRKTRFADATIIRNGRVVFHYQLPLEEYRVGDSPAEAFARVAADLFR